MSRRLGISDIDGLMRVPLPEVQRRPRPPPVDEATDVRRPIIPRVLVDPPAPMTRQPTLLVPRYAPCEYLHLSPHERIARLGLDGLCDRVAEGASIRSLAAWLGIDRCMLMRWINDSDHPDRRRLWEAACEASADAFAELAREIADEVPPTTARGAVDPGAVNDKRLRVEAARWMAAVRNRRRYGERVGVDSEPAREQSLEEMQRQVAYLLKRAGVTPELSGGPAAGSGDGQAVGSGDGPGASVAG